MTNAVVEEKANAILKAENPASEPVGPTWANRYLIRHGDALRKHWSKPLDRNRVNSATPEAVDAYFKHYISIVGSNGNKIVPELQFAFDETGLQPSIFRSQRVIGGKERKHTTSSTGSDRQLVTFVPVISAANKFVMGMMIYPGAQVRKSYLGTQGNPHNLMYVFKSVSGFETLQDFIL